MIVSLLLILCLCPMWDKVSTAPVDQVCKVKKTDVIFVLDASSSITSSDFARVLQFVLTFVDDIPTVGKEGTQVGVYTFGTSFKNEIQLGRYQDKASLKSAILSIQQLGGMTNTHLVLDDVLNNGFDVRMDARPDANRAVVVITDGESLQPKKTKVAAEALHKENILTFAIGVGQKTNANELKTIASTDENAISVKDFMALQKVEKQVNSMICEQKQAKCKTVSTDVIFVLDASTSISPSDFALQLEFVTKFIQDAETIGRQGTQIGIYTFANSSVLNFPLGVYQDKASMISAVKQIAQLGGITNTHLALEGVIKDGFSPAFGARSGVQRAVVVITDGQSVQQAKTIKAAEVLHQTNIYTFAIGVGKKIDKAELKKIASSEQNFFSVIKFSQLKTLEDSINKVVCEKPKCKTVSTDVIFVLDASTSISPSDFALQLEFVTKFIQDAETIGRQGTQIGIYTFANSSVLNFPLGVYQDKASMISAVKQIAQLGGITNTHLALEGVIKDGFSSAFGARSGVQRAVVVITDGQSVQQAKTIKAAEVLHQTNVHTFAIGVGKKIDKAELKKIASSEQNFFSVIKFSQLKTLEDSINKVVCEKPICSINPVDVVFVLDSSSSLTDSDFKKEISFVANFVSHSKIGPQNTQVSLFTYADKSNYLIKLNDFKDKASLLLKLKNTQRDHGFTNTDKALVDVRKHAFSSANGGRGSNVKQVVIVITDGASVMPEATKAAAEALHALNVDVFAVGVGQKIAVIELHNIGSNISNVFTVPDFKNLMKIEKKIMKEVCVTKKRKQTITVCTSKPADVIFVLDSSDSVRDKDFAKYRAFLNNFVEHATIGPQNIQVGLFLFATDSTSLIRLGDLNDKVQLKQRIQNMQRIFGVTYTDKALQDVRMHGFTTANGGRGTNVDQVVVVITDGVSLKPKATKDAALQLRAMNVEIYAVGIGNTDITELYNIGSGSDHVYTVPDFKTLSQIENRLFKQVCRNKTIDGSGVTPKDGGATPKDGGVTSKGGGVTPKDGGATPKDGGASSKDGGATPKGGNTTPLPIHCQQKMADVVFLLDTSDSITDAIFKKELDVVIKFINSHTIGPQDVQVALAMYAGRTTEVFSVGTHKTRPGLLQAVTVLQRSAQMGSTNTAAALKLAQSKLLQTTNGARLASHKVVIIITDGAVDDLMKTNTVITSLQKSGVNIIAVGVGVANIADLKIITGKTSNILVIPKGVDKDMIGDKIYKGKCGPVKP